MPIIAAGSFVNIPVLAGSSISIAGNAISSIGTGTASAPPNFMALSKHRTLDGAPYIGGAVSRDSIAMIQAIGQVTYQVTTPAGRSDLTQYESPSASGFSILAAVAKPGQNIFLLLTPTGDFAAGTITLPNVAMCIDGQQFICCSTHAITALTVAGNGSTVISAPTAMVANQAFALRWDKASASWFPNSGGAGGLTDAQNASVAASFAANGGVVSPFIAANDGRRYAVVACVLRNINDGGGWRVIADSVHGNINVSSVTNDTSVIVVNWAGLSVKKVISFVACPDDTYAKAGYFFGSSVGVNAANISIRKQRSVADYVSYNGSAFVSNTVGVFTQTSYTSGVLTLSHASVNVSSDGIIASLVQRDGTYVAHLGSAAATSTQVKFYDWAGTLITVADANMKFYLNRGQYSGAEDPSLTYLTSANVWCYGVMELN